MRNTFKIFVFSLVIVFISFGVADAQRGCCSHHGGVCDCACCDGTPLSSKCAPYYDCGKKNQKTNKEKVSDTVQAASPNDNSDNASSSSDEIVSFNTQSLKYHCPSCQWAIKCTRNCISVTLAKAKSSGGIPCKVCGGRCN